MCCNFPNVAHFFKCAALFQEWRISSRVVHFSVWGAFYRECFTLASVAIFCKCAACATLFNMCGIFPAYPSVVYFLNWRAYWYFVLWRQPHFSKCAVLLEVGRIFPSAAHFPSVRRTFQSVPHFCKSLGAFFQVWLIFPGVAYFFKSEAIFQVGRIFLSVLHFYK